VRLQFGLLKVEKCEESLFPHTRDCNDTDTGTGEGAAAAGTGDGASE
jgi:hypothetical protein